MCRVSDNTRVLRFAPSEKCPSDVSVLTYSAFIQYVQVSQNSNIPGWTPATASERKRRERGYVDKIN